MIQEPLTNLEKILQEPVFNISGQTPALKRLTVKLVALEPSSLKVSPVRASGFTPIGDALGFTSVIEANGFRPVAEASEFTPTPESLDESEEDEDWFFSNDETPVARLYTPQPESDVYTPPVERARISDPALPIFSPDLAYFGDGAMAAVAFNDIAEMGQGFGLRSDAMPSLQGTLQGTSWTVDPTLLWLTALLLLGILGGIGFGYLLTFVYQG
jgi:hypothetical protein